ncbi:MAG: transglutaminase family protein, partial [Oscillospiraceae bacterium]|nr:transglutaminase family protein [Oscillospiraceae bacterium]
YDGTSMTPFEHLCSSKIYQSFECSNDFISVILNVMDYSDDSYTLIPVDDSYEYFYISDHEPMGYSYITAHSADSATYDFDPLDPDTVIFEYPYNVKANYSNYAYKLTLEKFIEKFYDAYLNTDLRYVALKNFSSPFYSQSQLGYIDYLYNYSEYFDVDVNINHKVTDFIDSNITDRRNSEVINALKKYFETNYSYSLDVKPTPDGEDFVEYFLNEMDAGSCTYFASSAVQILRYYGIPARYAEGFAFTPKNGVEVDGRYYYSVPDYAAHAWVEYYDFELGWLPLEFTVSDNEPQSNNTDTNTTTTTTTTTTPTATTTTTPSQQLPPQQSTTPIQSDTPSQTVTSAGSVNNSKYTDYSFILIIVFILCIIGIIVLGYVYLRNRKLRELDDEISSDSANKNAIGLYRQALEYLRFFGIEASGNLTDSVHAKRLYDILSQSELSELDGCIEEVCELAQIAKLSDEILTEEDIAPLRKFHGDVKASVFEKLSRFGKLRARFISMLYR